MAWYNTEINTDPYVLWSRVRFFRNLEGDKFNLSLDRKKLSGIISKASEILQNNGFHLSEESGDVAYLSYAELGYADLGFIASEMDKVLYMNEPCSLCVTVGGRDMFCIQALLCGMAIEEAYCSANEAEVLLDGVFDFAYLDDVGYLSPEISHTGHGIDMSLALYLPAISGLDIIGKITKKANMCNFDLYPMTTYDKNPGNIFILDYIPNNSISPKDAAEKIVDFAKYIISIEKEYEHNVFGDNNAILNKAWRTFGIMEYCSDCSEDELLRMISDIRICHCLGCNSSLPYPVSLGEVNRLQAELMNTYIRLANKEESFTQDKCDKERSKILNSYIKSFKRDKGN